MAKLPITGEYPDNWAEIAQKVEDEARWVCLRCKHAHQPEVGRTLTVHHFDSNKSNCDRWNLMPLCQACHLSVQGRVNPQTPLLMEPADWVRPYIAGFYESGQGMPGPTYSLASWIKKYEQEVGQWPDWAPR